MEALTRLVADSLARHGFDRPVDPRRLQWSRWFRCDSTHSLLVVPSKPGIFALAEEIMDLGRQYFGGEQDPCGDSRPRLSSRAKLGSASTTPTLEGSTDREGHDFSSEPALSSEARRRVPFKRLALAEGWGRSAQRCDPTPQECGFSR